MRKVIAIAAMNKQRVIGKDNKIPWHVPEDLKHFAVLTKGHTVLMGRKTFDSLSPKYKPLPQRKNIIASRGDPSDTRVEWTKDPVKFVEEFKSGAGNFPSDILWIIGGEQIYKATLPLWDGVELTYVENDEDGDAFFPEFESNFSLVSEEKFKGFSFLSYKL